MEDFVDMSALLGCGVYALLERGRVVYVGQSKLPLRRLYEHALVKGRLKGKERFRFDEVWVRPCGIDELDAVEAMMISKYAPKHNLRAKAGAPMPKAISNMIAEAKLLPQGFDRRGM